MTTTLVTFSLLLLLRIAGGGETPPRPVTVIGYPFPIAGLRGDPHQVAWTNDLTLWQVIDMHPMQVPGSPGTVELRRVLADGTVSTIVRDHLTRRFPRGWKDDPKINPKLQPGDRVV